MSWSFDLYNPPPSSTDVRPAILPAIPLAVPTTGRATRAKKGVPVHTCDLCKPPKTFTRGEHLIRHQLSHKAPEFPCKVPNCGKAFHRADLLERHMQNHGTAEPSTATAGKAPKFAIGGSDSEEEVGRDSGDIEESHTYSTLSRDQTSASGWKTELLQVLRPAKPTNNRRPRQRYVESDDYSNGFNVRQLYSGERPSFQLPSFPSRPAKTMATAEINLSEEESTEPTWPLRGPRGSMDDEGYLNHLRVQVEYLEKELQRQANQVVLSQGKETKSGPTFETLYVIERSDVSVRPAGESMERGYHMVSSIIQPGRQTTSQMTYLDEPTWLVGPNQEFILTANFPITDLDGYLGQKSKAAFIMVKTYTPHQQISDLQRACREKRALPRPKPSNEYIRIISEDMIAAAEDFFGRHPKFGTDFPKFNVRNPIASPYLCWYFYRSDDAFAGMCLCYQRHMELLTGEMEKSCGDTYRKINSQFKRQVVSFETIQFLFRPGDVLLSKDGRKQEAFIALGRAVQGQAQQNPPRRPKDWARRTGNDDVQRSYTWNIDAWSYQYDGHFYKAERKDENSLNLYLNVSHYEEEVPMSCLNLLPLAYADRVFAERLVKRGEIFWSCRHKKLVSYQERLDQFATGTGERFMIDFLTYRQLHSDSPFFTKKYLSNNPLSRNYMDEGTMRNDEPPPAPEIYLFPDTLPGFNLRTKKWIDLDVDRIQGVKWNKKAFENLVIDRETKELIQALVTNQSETDHDADLIESKGNGLIMLLHGGPGTGKTFTAETVAEMAEKPLFRVTCGDIGTKPENVEKYLESALNLGKIWKCVVLLDEADVFLEQRTLTDLERNALVSVFLRVLEYYEGIMILTSNRVGTFDEAFKSRIQLSLHYENLKKAQRRQIWKNFLDRLSSLQDERTSSPSSPARTAQVNGLGKTEDFGIDFDDINDYLKELSNYELNGRQIRNAITTARQLAKFKRETMSYAHLKHVIDVASKFDTYLGNLTGFSGDDMARENGIR